MHGLEVWEKPHNDSPVYASLGSHVLTMYASMGFLYFFPLLTVDSLVNQSPGSLDSPVDALLVTEEQLPSVCEAGGAMTPQLNALPGSRFRISKASFKNKI